MQISPSIIISYMKIKEGVINFFSKNKKIALLYFFILLFIIPYFLIDFSSQSLVAHDEGLYARRARLILESDNWFSPPFPTPHHKTLGSYWFIALSISLFGKSEFALRFPSIFSSFLCLISSYLIALKITNKRSALISLFSLSSMPLWIQYSRYASPDFPFVLCILLVILFFLKSLDNPEYIWQYFYIFLSGFFISISFFIRSYMAFVPLLGLSPFIYFNLYKKENTRKILFFTGIIFGSIPTFLNLYYSFRNYGTKGITILFEFVKKQVVGEVGFNNILILPLKFIYLTFPIGILLLILFIFSKSTFSVKYPLLIYFYPLFSLSLLLCMSTSYPHYYLFLLPPLSILFALYLTSYSERYLFSQKCISYLLITIILLISTIIIFAIFKYNDILIQYSYGNIMVIYIPLSLLLLSYITSIRFIFDINHLRFNLTNFLFNIILPQYISLSLFFNFGVLGNPNYYVKKFIKDENIALILENNIIYLYNIDSKIQTLLSYYLPSFKVIYNFDKSNKYKYIITTNSYFTYKSGLKQNYKLIKKFDNHSLLMNISE